MNILSLYVLCVCARYVKEGGAPFFFEETRGLILVLYTLSPPWDERISFGFSLTATWN